MPGNWPPLSLCASLRRTTVQEYSTLRWLDEDLLWPDKDIAVAEAAGYFEATGRYVPNLLNFQQQAMEYEGPTPDDPVVLGAITAPVVVVHGSDTKPYDLAAARHVADHLPNARIQEIPGAGHAAPLTHPEALAEALTEFFSPARQLA